MKQSSKSRLQKAIWLAVTGIAVSAAWATTPTEQQAIVQTGNGGPEVLKLETVPVLAPAAGQVLIRVYAAAVNPVDWKMRQGMSMGGPPRIPAANGTSSPGAPTAPAPSRRIPGFDVAGVIERVGAGVTSFKAGEPVFSMIGMTRTSGLNGGYSQYVIAPAANVVEKPRQLTYAEAAGLGTAGMTGARNVDQVHLSRGQTLLITGVAGGVGSSAAQIALAEGVHVVGTASPRHAAYLKSIGITDVLDYEHTDWVDKARSKGIDAVLDTVGGDTSKAAFSTLKKGGTFAGVGEPRTVTPDMCAAAGMTCVGNRGPGATQGPSEGELLQQVARLASAGKFKVHVEKGYPLAEAAKAQEDNRGGHTEGKIVLIVTDKANRRE